jgi:lipopolysaccharide export system permease protein
MFMLIMQFLWKYIDDLIGKGIETMIILELFFYVSATLIPLALPLAMLLSSIMTLGNLAENNELTALKSAGQSLFQILKPLTLIVSIICVFTFMFSNFVIPVATLKWRALIYDIQETKIATILTPGTYSTMLDGYAIKIAEGNDQKFKDITIHDHTDLNVIKTVKADSGEVYKAKNGSFLFFKLYNGSALEEMNSNNSFQNNIDKGFYPCRISSFKEASYKIDIKGFKINRSDEKLFKDQYEMWNVFQISKAFDSISKQSKQDLNNYVKNVLQDHHFYNVRNFKPDSINNIHNKNTLNENNLIEISKKDFTLEKMDQADLINAYQSNISRIRRKLENLNLQKEHIKMKAQNFNQFQIEFNKKFSLSFAVFVLFFVGAPLGAIVKKGGFGTPVVIAALLFLVYYVLTEIGLNLANTNVLSPFFGVWLSTLILVPIAFYLMRRAAKDRNLFNFDGIKKIFKRNNERTSFHK